MPVETPPTPEFLAQHPVVGRDAWLQARLELLAAEKKALQQMDEVARKRRSLPWVEVREDYRFEGPDGQVPLEELFRGRSQLIVYHFMFGPGWKEGCPGCSLFSDHVDGARMHFENHDVAFSAVSRAPWTEFRDFKKRMGWSFPWFSSHGSSFNFDFGVSFTPEQIATGRVVSNYGPSDHAHDELHGLSVFFRNPEGRIFHTYSTYARGVDGLVGTLQFLDLTPKGRNESDTMDWVRHHDRYDAPTKSCNCSC